MTVHGEGEGGALFIHISMPTPLHEKLKTCYNFNETQSFKSLNYKSPPSKPAAYVLTKDLSLFPTPPPPISHAQSWQENPLPAQE